MLSAKRIRDFILEEKDVLSFVRVINKHGILTDISIGNCGWKEEPNKWFVSFYATNKTYEKIIADLLKMGQLKITQRPGGQIDVNFEGA